MSSTITNLLQSILVFLQTANAMIVAGGAYGTEKMGIITSALVAAAIGSLQVFLNNTAHHYNTDGSPSEPQKPWDGVERRHHNEVPVKENTKSPV